MSRALAAALLLLAAGPAGAAPGPVSRARALPRLSSLAPVPRTPRAALSAAAPRLAALLFPAAAGAAPAAFSGAALALPAAALSPGPAAVSAAALARSPGGDHAPLRQAGALSRAQATPYDWDMGALPKELPTPAELAPAPDGRETLDLRFDPKARTKLKKSEITAAARLIRGKGSRWYWGKFDKGSPVRVLIGGRHAFASRLESAETKRVSSLSREDLAGLYPAQAASRKGGRFVWSLPRLRELLLRDLAKKEEKNGEGALKVGLRSEIRLLRFIPQDRAAALPENAPEADPAPRARAPVEIPAELAPIGRMLPKLVLLDLRLFPDRIPAELIQDMGKLSRSGVFFALLSEKPLDGPGSVREQIARSLTPAQRDYFLPYRLLVLSEDGNALSAYDGAFPESLPLPGFSSQELERLQYAALRVGGAESIRKATRREFSLTLRPGADEKRFQERFLALLSDIGVGEVRLSLSRRGPSVVLSARRNNIESALPELLRSAREQLGLYVLESDIAVISEDPALLERTKGSVQLNRHLPRARGAELVEVSLAAMLGGFRESRPGDIPLSPSRIKSVERVGKGGAAWDKENIKMRIGTLVHETFNWLCWKYRREGTLPSRESFLKEGTRIWLRSEASRAEHLLGQAGESMGEAYGFFLGSLKRMYGGLAERLKTYPIIVGTELPNIMVLQRYKKSEPSHRDILRFIYDLVLARRTPEGLELVVVDFKTGPTPTLRKLGKDYQYILYHTAPKAQWPDLSLPYGLTGRPEKVTGNRTQFLFTGFVEPLVDGWDILNFEKGVARIANRLRRQAQPPKPSGNKGKKKK